MKLVAWLSCLVVGLATGTAAPATVASPSPGPAGERAAASHSDAVSIRHSTLLDTDWRSIALDTGAPVPPGVESAGFDDHGWRRVEVPHNWDEYEGFRQLRHGDRHGTAWYRRSFTVDSTERGRRIFLYFEGVGSYATVWVNGTPVGRHAGGLTTFTLDITDAVRFGQSNCLVVRADHPAGIRDLPWVCGGCELAYGFSEGTQPFGIFRPVHLVTTSPVRIEPFGVHVWNDADLDPAAARIHVTTEVKNYGPTATTVAVVTRVIDSPPGPARQAGAVVSESSSVVTLAAGATTIVAQEPPPIAHAQLWSPDSPHLYALESEILDAGPLAGRPPSSALPARHGVVDTLTTPFGIRTVRWPAAGSQDGRLLINGRPFFLNGICDYEHNLGASGAFTSEEIRARVHEIEAAGFNAFRDAHTPHNLRFQKYWDRDGLLWWPQFGAHIWFDNPEFRANFKARLRDWVKERRNSPSLVLWGLQNESVLPTKFAEECSAIIRELDPTASSQRKITTCNGGTGTDWNVPQNWSGTYGGNPLAYADELRRDHLFGEYGAWRSLGLHTEGGFQPNGPLSEDRMCALLETKVRLAESVRDKVAGHFLWLFATHSNPGRNVGEHGEQQDDGIRPLDHIGPANNKGLFTIWGEPTDAYQMYRSDYASAATAPMVYIVSHTWPDRWTTPGAKSGIVVYSNCDQVELFNDLRSHSLGVRSRPSAAGPGRTIAHFEWDNVPVTTNILYAEGLVNGTVVARDIIELHHLEPAPAFRNWQDTQRDPVAPRPGRTYLYRVNCGGPDYVDRDGNRWAADHDYSPGDSWGSISWAAAFPNLPPRFGSQRKTYDPIAGTRDPALFRTYRYGRDQLRYVFSVPNGEYEVELYFVEPWYGDWTADHLPGPTVPVPSAHAAGLDCTGWRLFDVAVNGSTVLQHLDLWREAGRDTALKKIVPAKVTDGRLEISFPRVESGQA
ncbi:MAG TPA: malectin domain-containing carbohydrate-binding protein, partial [Opitutaceae bacterium]|nr:malectin domain-containing carbohydrate-binding protein [Opitutaceae bacterium]